jgi:dTDP-4-amino-4,6-dideoxygalactose transaminase
MANAELGDDVYGDDPTVKALERATAELLGTEDAVYMPTGTMTNQVGIRAHTGTTDSLLEGDGFELIGPATEKLPSGAPCGFRARLHQL